MRASLRAAVAFIITLAIVITTVLGSQRSNDVSPTQHCNQQTSLADAPALRLHVDFKRKSMQIHGEFIFDVFANPVVSTDNASVRYDGFATFYKPNTQFTYMLVDGAGYVIKTLRNDTTAAASQTVRCVPPVIPFDSFVPALNNAVAISRASVSDDAINCAGGNLLKMSLGGQDFVICASGASGASGFIAYSNDMTVAVEYLNAPLNISAPTLTDGSTSRVAAANATSVTEITRSLLTGNMLPPSSYNLKDKVHLAINGSACACKSTPRPYAFLPTQDGQEAELHDTTDGKFGDAKA